MENLRICSVCGRELPLSEFYTHKNSKDGYSRMCKSCHRESIAKHRAAKKSLEEIASKGGKQLSDYTPRELMKELHSRGYRGKLKFVEVHEIDLDKLDD